MYSTGTGQGNSGKKNDSQTFISEKVDTDNHLQQIPL